MFQESGIKAVTMENGETGYQAYKKEVSPSSVAQHIHALAFSMLEEMDVAQLHDTLEYISEIAGVLSEELTVDGELEAELADAEAELKAGVNG